MKKEVKLLPHNEKAYNKLIACLKSNNFVAINHATGTGKSFIMLKYLYENRDKRILYLAPTYPILEQLTEDHMEELGINISEFKCFDTMIYRNLLSYYVDDLTEKYDIIVLDEYHRCGAKKWGDKVNRLLDKVKDKDVKVIGLTATEIRYLDNEKNMNNILFDGVCASKLSLADAILQGILPAPRYVNTIYSIIDEIGIYQKRINQKIFYNHNRTIYQSIIDEIIDECTSYLNERHILKFEDNEKDLVFCQEIKSIKEAKQIMQKIFKDKIINEYEVHSDKEKEINKKSLKEFREKKEGINILYSVNILNEGVHVKDIQRIFMFRKTKSPIIYYQQLGRLLSYSSRKKDVYVYDLVNNIRNHRAIYDLYSEVMERARQLLIIDSSNEERYKKIIENFKIVDFSSKLYKKIDELKNMLSSEQIIIQRLDTAISILEGKIETNYMEKMQAQIDIFKFQNYININQFSIIKQLDVKKPDIFNLTVDEFNQKLKGNSNINKLMKEKNKEFDNEIKEYCNNNNTIPSLFSTGEELELAIRLNNNFSKLSNDTKNIIRNITLNNNLNIYDRLNYNTMISEFNIDELIYYLKIIIQKGIKISHNMAIVLKVYKIDIKEYGGVKEVDNYNALYVNNDERMRKYYSQKIDELGEEKVVEEVYLELKDYLELFGNLEKFDFNHRNIRHKYLLFYDLLEKYGYLKLLSESNNIDNEKKYEKYNEVLLKYVEFIRTNRRYPMPIFEEEKKLRDDFNKIKRIIQPYERKLLNETLSSMSEKEMMMNAYEEYKKRK